MIVESLQQIKLGTNNYLVVNKWERRMANLLNGVTAEWRWSGKVAVVTGASSGIGEAIALTLAEKGVIVVALARRKGNLDNLSTRTNGKIIAIQCDFLKEEDIISTFRAIEERLGGVDILINNAGTAIIGKLMDGATEDWKAVLNLNVLGLSIATREALKTMRTRGDNGHIININSICGHKVLDLKGFTIGMYHASKYGVTALTQVLANELAEEKSTIKVTSLSPGMVETELVRKLQGGGEDGTLPLVKAIESRDIADGVVYILSTRPNVQVPELTIQPIG